MKKLIIILLFFSFFIVPAVSEAKVKVKADDRFIKNEANISIGTISLVGLSGGIISSIADTIAQDNTDKQPFEAFSLGVGYNLILVDFIGFGGFLNFERFGNLNLVSAQAKLTAQYGWTRFKFYHSISGGVLFVSDKAITPIFDVTLLGLKLDFDDFNIFLEASAPSTAFLKLGYSYYL
ncbi:MAG: hypothetical protein K6G09_12310 [Treponema sp.]|nr:hypothetical protein [Treponema sp.]